MTPRHLYRLCPSAPTRTLSVVNFTAEEDDQSNPLTATFTPNFGPFVLPQHGRPFLQQPPTVLCTVLQILTKATQFP